MAPQIYSGARLIVSINDQVVGAGFVADYNISTSSTEIDTVDLVAPVELAPTRIRVSMSMRVYRTQDNDPAVTGFASAGPGFSSPPGDGSASLFGNKSFASNEAAGDDKPSPLINSLAEQKAFTQARYITIEIKDDYDRTVFRIPRAMLTSRSASVSVGNFLQESWQIVGIGYSGPTP